MGYGEQGFGEEMLHAGSYLEDSVEGNCRHAYNYGTTCVMQHSGQELAVNRFMKSLILIGLAGLAACLDPPHIKPQPTEAQKKALQEANVILTACTASDIEQVKALLEKNPALVNAQDDAGATPLSRAVSALNPSADLVRLLLAKGAQVEGTPKYGGRPLRSAALQGRRKPRCGTGKGATGTGTGQ